MSFERALDLILEVEGGFVDDPDDPGGATNFGVTQGTYSRWRRSQGFSDVEKSVAEINEAEVTAVYFDLYWKPSHCPEIAEVSPDLAVLHFDGAVNTGVEREMRLLQKSLHRFYTGAIDGLWGPLTRGAVEEALSHNGEEEVILRLLWQRVEWYYEISDGQLRKFLRGWLWRLRKVKREVLG